MGKRRQSGPVCLPPATEEGCLIGWVANVPPKMGTANPSVRARKGITSSRAGIPEPLGIVAHANPQGAGRSLRADVAQTSEKRVLESNIAGEYQQCTARKHARRRLAHRKRAVCSKGKGGRTASHGRTGGQGMQACKQAHDTENAASMANPALRSNKGVTPVVRPDKPYLSAVPPTQPISPPAQPMRCRPPARPRRFPPTRMHLVPKNVPPPRILSRRGHPFGQWTLPMQAFWQCLSCAGLFARPRPRPATAPRVDFCRPEVRPIFFFEIAKFIFFCVLSI